MWVTIYKCEIHKALQTPLIRNLIDLVLEYFDTFASPFAPFQQRAFDACCVARMNVFITGPAGTGKTFLLESIVRRLRALEQRVVVTASTGIAAIMIEGQTLHSFTKLMKLQQHYPDLSIDDERTYWITIYENVDVLIIDEISMITPDDFAVLVRLWHDLDILSRMQVILLGDFFQLPAVIKNEKNEKNSNFQYCFETPEWSQVVQRYVYLHDVFRQADQEFVRSLNAIRIGQFTAFDIERLQQRWIHHAKYSNPRPVLKHKDEYTWIFPTNDEADQHNQDVVIHMPGDTHEYTAKFGYAQVKSNGETFNLYSSIDTVPPNRAFYFTDPRYRKQFHVKERLHLKKGVRVLLTVNLRTEHGLVNGARGTVIGFAQHKLPFTNGMLLPIVKFDNGATVHILLQEWKTTVEWTVQRQVRAYLWMVQLPLRYAYATTVHQSQGQTLTNVVIAPRRIFQFGQGYVALSRARTIGDLHLLDPLSASMFRVNQIVQRFYETIV